ncbi:cysteine synthase family protein [Sulfuracidifex metallicus]|uniref:Pyridoxal-phosphate dependent enzyme n=1 Tax=Sulfuracidifex metallicus DSM 6482 = JCM 9184 TaxID=523847 RepID=A0A6A9QJY7_SULME|nr:cysteine synthase family protein [Sulfuracidifex metallicus]MUN28048.1 pyridoxal-phosphate dependent enzyme [Sulfuracidifex metallicus DSM 6482 = JCM 9184]WOE51405.1 cysteine synthase family protein [Sulfuracidifex metallicus DSM 6482 = JCM 9184]
MSKDLHVFEDSIDLLEGMWPTPLLKLNIGKDVWGKLEFYNPFSRSIKDRTAYYLFKEAIKREAKAMVEATSGNTGIALASMASSHGINFTMFVPATASKVYRLFASILGAEVFTAGEKTADLIPLVKQYSSVSNAVNLDQFNNPVNLLAHYNTTAKEIDEQLTSQGLTPQRIIATMGTGGHIAGISKYFKEKYGDEVEIIGVQPAEGSRIPGLKRQDFSNNSLLALGKVDRVMDISLEEAVDGVKLIGRTSGILIGISAGATVSAFNKVKDDRTTVLIFPDDAFKYVDVLEQILKTH